MEKYRKLSIVLLLMVLIVSTAFAAVIVTRKIQFQGRITATYNLQVSITSLNFGILYRGGNWTSATFTIKNTGETKTYVRWDLNNATKNGVPCDKMVIFSDMDFIFTVEGGLARWQLISFPDDTVTLEPGQTINVKAKITVLATAAFAPWTWDTSFLGCDV